MRRAAACRTDAIAGFMRRWGLPLLLAGIATAAIAAPARATAERARTIVVAPEPERRALVGSSTAAARSHGLQERSIDELLAVGIAALERGDLVAAIPAFQAAVAAAPDAVDPLYYLGIARLRAGDLDSAVESLRRAGEQSRSFRPEIAYQLAVALMRGGHLDDARAQFEAILERDPAATMPRLNLGWILLQENRGMAALELYRDVLADDPDSALAHYYVGFVHHANGEFEAAEAAYNEALRLQPDLVEAGMGLGRLLLGAGDTARAKQLYERVLATRPDLAEAHFRLGVVALRDGDLDAAVSALERAVSLDPDYQPALYNLGLAYARAGKPLEGEREMAVFATLRQAASERQRERLRGLAESRSDIQYRRGMEALERGDAAIAAEAFATAVELGGEAPAARAYLGLGGALLSLGRVSEAREALENARDADPELAAAYKLLADAYDLLGLEELANEARITYERLVAGRRKSSR